MKILTKTIWLVLMAMLLTNVSGINALAEEPTMEDLKKQIEKLQNRVDELESTQKTQQEEEDDSWGYFNRRRSNNRWDPFEEIHRMQEEMDNMFQHSFGRSGGFQGSFSNNMGFDYDFDINETDKGYEIKFDMKGLDKEKIDIEINDHSITVKGEHSMQQTEEGQDRYFSSQSFGSFMKTIPLPVDADTTKVKTEKEGDTLIIKLPKKTA